VQAQTPENFANPAGMIIFPQPHLFQFYFDKKEVLQDEIAAMLRLALSAYKTIIFTCIKVSGMLLSLHGLIELGGGFGCFP